MLMDINYNLCELVFLFLDDDDDKLKLINSEIVCYELSVDYFRKRNEILDCISKLVDDKKYEKNKYGNEWNGYY
jgi:hypothetical protein